MDPLSEFHAVHYQYLFHYPQAIDHLSEFQNLDSLAFQSCHLLPNHPHLFQESLRQISHRSILLHLFHFNHSLRSTPRHHLFHLFIPDLTGYYLLPNSHQSLHQLFNFAHYLRSDPLQFINQNYLNQFPNCLFPINHYRSIDFHCLRNLDFQNLHLLLNLQSLDRLVDFIGQNHLHQ